LGRGVLNRLAMAFIAAAILVLALVPAARAQTAGGLEAVPIESLSQPIDVDVARGSPDLVFVTRKSGVIQVLDDEDALPEPFLDITELVAAGGERGLLSLAFPPDYAKSRRFYVYFTNTAGDIEVDEFKRRAADPTLARESSRRRVIVIPHPGHANHNGGTVQVDARGRLWMATGDGGGGGDTEDNARRLGRLLGKLLRINPVPKRPRDPGYRIPKGNPFVGAPGRDEIWSYGLRNPFRFSFDEELRTVAIGDVGQGSREEVNVLTRGAAKGGNFGWPQYEGDQLFDPSRPGPGPPIPPTFAYPNPPAGQAAVTGGVIVRDPQLPTLEGRYLFADFYAGPLTSFIPDLANGEADDVRQETVTISQPAAFAHGRAGQLYVVSLAGTVYRLEPA
jgi:glucose/arabinose dehydrogenase